MNTERHIAPELLQKTLDASGIGWWRLDFEARELTCSQLAGQLLGVDSVRIPFENLYEVPEEEHRARLYTRCAALKVTDTFDETFVTVRGGWCLRASVVETGTDPLSGGRTAFGTLCRIAESVPEHVNLAAIGESYKATQRNYAHLAQLIEHMPIGYLRVNILRSIAGQAVDYLISYVNRQAGRILGVNPQEYAGKTAREAGADPYPYLETFLHTPARAFWEHNWETPDGSRVCRCMLYNTPGDVDELVILLEDITDATRGREQLADFENLFDMVSDFASVGCVSYNLCSGEGYARGPWAQNYGEAEDTPASQIIGSWRHVHPDDRERLQRQLARIRQGETTRFVEEVRILRDGEPVRWILAHMLCRDYRPAQGVIDLACVNYDITDLKHTEEQLREAKVCAEESNKLKSAFLANMSHEIRTPLNAIVGFSELLAAERSEAVREEYASIIQSNNALLLQIISDVLDLARIESGRMEIVRTTFDARAFCHETADSLRLQCPEGVELRVAEGLPPLRLTAYRQGLSQIIGNFTRNALKFTRRGSVTIGFGQRPGHLRFYVRDTGIGIAPEQHGRIFERFVKLDTFTQGTGLGLSICKSIVEQLGGRIGVDSVVGEGSCFWLDIPAGA